MCLRKETCVCKEVCVHCVRSNKEVHAHEHREMCMCCACVLSVFRKRGMCVCAHV